MAKARRVSGGGANANGSFGSSVWQAPEVVKLLQLHCPDPGLSKLLSPVKDNEPHHHLNWSASGKAAGPDVLPKDFY